MLVLTLPASKKQTVCFWSDLCFYSRPFGKLVKKIGLNQKRSFCFICLSPIFAFLVLWDKFFCLLKDTKSYLTGTMRMSVGKFFLRVVEGLKHLSDIFPLKYCAHSRVFVSSDSADRMLIAVTAFPPGSLHELWVFKLAGDWLQNPSVSGWVVSAQVLSSGRSPKILSVRQQELTHRKEETATLWILVFFLND